MRVITVARKPLAGTVAQTALKFGTGGINIDGCRLSTSDNLNGGAYGATRKSDLPGAHRNDAAADMFAPGRPPLEYKPPLGRFPANLILCHLQGCTCVGTKEIATDTHFPKSRPQGSQISGPSGHTGQEGLEEVSLKKETVSSWECIDGCPVADLDRQSAGSVTGVRSPRSQDREVPGTTWYVGNHKSREYPNESGGVSRFFKQTKSD